MIAAYKLVDEQLVRIDNPDDMTLHVWIDVQDDLSQITKLQKQLAEYSHTGTLIREALDAIVELKQASGTNWRIVKREMIVLKFFAINLDVEESFDDLYIIIYDGVLITIREMKAETLNPLRENLDYRFSDYIQILHEICTLIVNRNATYLGEQFQKIDELSSMIFNEEAERLPISNVKLKWSLFRIGSLSQLAIKLQKSMDSINATLDFIANDKFSKDFFGERHADLGKNSESLMTEIRFLQASILGLMQNVSYITNASLGIIGINQNKTSRFLSLIAGLFAPASLIISYLGSRISPFYTETWLDAVPTLVISILTTSAIFYWLYRKGASNS